MGYDASYSILDNYKIMKSLATLSLLVFALVFTSCDETKKVIDVAGNVQLSGNYTVTNVDGTSMSATKPTITFAALSGRVSGNAGCNFLPNF